MSHCDGADKSCVRTNCGVENSGRRASFLDQEDISFEAGFRGFEKTPRVLLQRHDITPYLDKESLQKYQFGLGKVIKSENSIDLSKFLAKCSVKILKVDLEGLQKYYSGRCPHSNGTMVDPNSKVNIICKICEKVYASEKKLQNHQGNKHMLIYRANGKPKKRVSFSDKVIIHEVKEYHKCRKCPKIFEFYKSLKNHMKLRHKKRKCYICNYCTTKFVDRTFFKVHIKLHCDVCSLLLPNKSKYLQHKRNVCRIIKLHKCRTCDKSFFNFMDLKDHSYEHIGTFFICDICKDQCSTKCEIGHHVSFLHSKKRPTSLYTMRNLGNERLYLCNFCDESSVDKDVIETHVQVLPDLMNKAMTGYKDYYFCDQCLKKFDTEKDMLQHKWTHFLKTSDNSQVRSVDTTQSNSPENNVKRLYKLNEIPESFQPKVILEKIKVGGKILTEPVPFVDVKSFDENNGDIRKPVVHPKTKKTLISRHQCQTCGKYYSSNYSLNRHMETQHGDYESLRCKVCEETFVWPSLLQTHKCIRISLPEKPFEDARPEIHFDNLHEITNIDDLNIDSYENEVDFEIPAPIVELTEYENNFMIGAPSVDRMGSLQNIGYKLVMQEVPIEF